MSPQAFDYWSLGLGILGVVLGAWALIKQYLDRPRIKLISVNTAITGSGSGGVHKYNVMAIEVVLENSGTRPALRCQAMATFPKIEGLPLHPQTPEHFVDTSTRNFDINPNDRVRVVGAWKYLPGGVLSSEAAPFKTFGEFLDNATPITIVVKLGTKQFLFVHSREAVKARLDKYEREVHLGYPLS